MATDKRKRAIRALARELGVNYTTAARVHDARRSQGVVGHWVISGPAGRTSDMVVDYLIRQTLDAPVPGAVAVISLSGAYARRWDGEPRVVKLYPDPETMELPWGQVIATLEAVLERVRAAGAELRAAGVEPLAGGASTLVVIDEALVLAPGAWPPDDPEGAEHARQASVLVTMLQRTGRHAGTHVVIRAPWLSLQVPAMTYSGAGRIVAAPTTQTQARIAFGAVGLPPVPRTGGPWLLVQREPGQPVDAVDAQRLATGP